MNSSSFETSLEVHPWKAYIPSNASKLIIGTFPPHVSRRKFEFFYPNPSNRFWRILARIASKDLIFRPLTEEEKELAVAERKQLLEELNLGITDMGAVVERRNNRSTDEHLTPLEFTDILNFLQTHPHIHTLIFTSSAKGNSAWAWFQMYGKQNSLVCEMLEQKGIFPKRGKLEHGGKTYELIILRSPSGAAAYPFEELVKQYRSVLVSK